MMKQEWESWQPWQVRLFGFSLAWWFALAPSAANWEWKLATGADLPVVVRAWLAASYLMLIVGLLVAASILGASESSRAMRASRWFLAGLFCSPILIFLA